MSLSFLSAVRRFPAFLPLTKLAVVAAIGTAQLLTAPAHARDEIWVGFHPTAYECTEGSTCNLTVTKIGRGPATVKVSTDDQSRWQEGARFGDGSRVDDMWCEEGAALDDPCRDSATSPPLTRGAATYGEDYTLTLSDLNFAEDQTQITIPVHISTDAKTEGRETFYVNLTIDILRSPGNTHIAADDPEIQPRLRNPGYSARVVIVDR